MHRVFEALSHLLPLGVDKEAFSDPSRRADIERWLDVRYVGTDTPLSIRADAAEGSLPAEGSPPAEGSLQLKAPHS